MCWPLKRMPVSPADSCLSWADRISADFHSQMLCGRLFPGSGALGWAAQFEVETPHFSGGISAAEIAFWDLSPWDRGQPFLYLLPSCQSLCGCFCISLQITFRLFALHFSCNSRLILGRGGCNIHLLCHCLESPGNLLS